MLTYTVLTSAACKAESQVVLLSFTTSCAILVQALSQTEVDWVNAYHQEVWQKVSPRVQDSKLKEWIKTNTSPL